MGRPPRLTPTRPDFEMPVSTEKKTRIRKNAAMKSQLDIDKELMDRLHANGVDVQWVTDSVHGKSEPQMRNSFEVNAWEAVKPDMFGGAFDGMFTRKGHKGEIEFGGLVLMWRPMELTEEARAEDRKARDAQLSAQAAMIKGGQGIQGLAPGFEADHPTALSKNVLTRTVKPPMEIPTD